jgi:anthranilate synthase component 2
MKTLLLDNYDSFTFNLYQEIGELGGNPVVHRNDKISLAEVEAGQYTHIIIGPGPGNPSTPRDIGISNLLIQFAVKQSIPLFGVCLGHQILGQYFGGDIVKAQELFHGKPSMLSFLEPRSVLFSGLPSSIEAMRYHSLCVENLKEPLRKTAETNDGVLMAMEHMSLPLYGVQFHPESIGTPDGKAIVGNFLRVKRE